jgi:hypothetical protein
MRSRLRAHTRAGRTSLPSRRAPMLCCVHAALPSCCPMATACQLAPPHRQRPSPTPFRRPHPGTGRLPRAHIWGDGADHEQDGLQADLWAAALGRGDRTLSLLPTLPHARRGRRAGLHGAPGACLYGGAAAAACRQAPTGALPRRFQEAARLPRPPTRQHAAAPQVAPCTPPVGRPYEERQCCNSPLDALKWMLKMQTAPQVRHADVLLRSSPGCCPGPPAAAAAGGGHWQLCLAQPDGPPVPPPDVGALR